VSLDEVASIALAEALLLGELANHEPGAG